MNRIPNVICRGTSLRSTPRSLAHSRTSERHRRRIGQGCKKGRIKDVAGLPPNLGGEALADLPFLNIAKSARLKCGARRVLRPTPNGVPNTLSAFQVVDDELDLVRCDWCRNGVANRVVSTRPVEVYTPTEPSARSGCSGTVGRYRTYR